MNSAICTLFEGHYHYGVAALTNSLYKHGFRGAIYAGYKGELPFWAISAVENPALAWSGSRTLEVVEGLQLHFLPLDTDYHLTNYKPRFMLRLWRGPANQVDALAYFDPDIVIKCRWSFFERWMGHGVALVHEIISNDMPNTHPIRRDWEQLLTGMGLITHRRLNAYINGGFCGVSQKHQAFLHTWDEIISTAIQDYKPDPTKFMTFDRTYPFFSIDQDALNVTAMGSTAPISEIGPEGMDFVQAGWTMSHAVGSPKPWKKKFIFLALKGSPPSLAERAFWVNVIGPITCYSKNEIRIKHISILIAAFIGRLYRRF
jgi:hypothetical protein